MGQTKPPPQDHDSPWKEALEYFFQPFMQLLYLDIHDAIDWTVPAEFLDKELQKINHKASAGRRYADKLVKVRYRDGDACWILVHVEVQGEKEDAFAARMYSYYHRIRDRYGLRVISLAVLADTDPAFRPASFEEQLAGTGVSFRFRSIKLLDYLPRLEELKHDDNPFGLLIAAQLTAKLVRDGKTRADNLISFYRLAIHKQLERERIGQLVIFLEWMVALPESVNDYYDEQLETLQEEAAMTYISSFERKAMEKGVAQGLEQGLEQGVVQGSLSILLKQLSHRFGELDPTVLQKLHEASPEQLERWAENILDAQTLDEVFTLH